jgi:hypothetical protein
MPIPVWLSIIAIFIGYIGVHMAAHPPRAEEIKKKKFYKASFLFLSIAIVLLTWIQDRRNTNQLREQKEQSYKILENLSGQNHLTQKELDYMRGIVGEYDELRVEAFFEIAPNNPTEFILLQRICDAISPGYYKYPVGPGTNFFSMSGDAIGIPTPINLPSREEINGGQSNPIYSENIVGYVNFEQANPAENKKRSNRNTLPDYQNDIGLSVGADNVFTSNWVNSVSSNANLMNIVDFINAPKLQIRMFSQQTVESKDLANPDFYSPLSIFRSRPLLGYGEGSGNIILRWDFDFPSSKWRQTIRIGSIRDLDNATAYLYFDELPQIVCRDLIPVQITFRFGKTAITVTNIDVIAHQMVEMNGQMNEVTALKAIFPPPSFAPITAEAEPTNALSPEVRSNIIQQMQEFIKQHHPYGTYKLHPDN